MLELNWHSQTLARVESEPRWLGKNLTRISRESAFLRGVANEMWRARGARMSTTKRFPHSFLWARALPGKVSVNLEVVLAFGCTTKNAN